MMYDSMELRLIGNITALLPNAFFRWLSNSYSRNYLEPQIKDQPDVLKDYERRQRVIGYCAIGMLVMFLLPLFLPFGLLSESDKMIFAFVVIIILFVMQVFQVWEGLSYLISKGVKVSGFGKWIVVGSEILASGAMILYYFLLFSAYAREGKI